MSLTFSPELLNIRRHVIISGDRGEGKSTMMLRLYRAQPNGIGVCSHKVYDELSSPSPQPTAPNDGVVGYDLCTLPEERRWPLARLTSHLHDLQLSFPTSDTISQGRFVFSQQAFDEANLYLCNAITGHTPRVWIDEVGKIELRDAGFAPAVRMALQHGVPLVLCVRRQYVERVITHFFPHEDLPILYDPFLSL
jgi:nucleoside-triphosphatase THEP1